MAAFREPRKLGWRIHVALSLHMPADGAPDVGVDGGLCRLLRVDQNDRKREEHGNFTNMGAFRLHTFQSTHIDAQPTARNGARSVDARERRRRNGLERRQARRARTSGTRRVGLFGALRWRRRSVSRKFLLRTMSISRFSEGRNFMDCTSS